MISLLETSLLLTIFIYQMLSTLSLRPAGIRTLSLLRRSLAANRVPANHESLDSELVATKPDLIRSHLIARRFKDDIFSEIDKFQGIRAERSQLIFKGDTARSNRKLLSKQIGVLMQKGDLQGAEKLKEDVKIASEISEESSRLVEVLDSKLETILRNIPNLVDDR